MLNLASRKENEDKLVTQNQRLKKLYKRINEDPEERIKFYQKMGWYDSEGLPTKEFLVTLSEIKLAEQIEQDLAKAR